MFDYKGFMQDFMIADAFGEDAIRDTFNRARQEWRTNPDYYGSLVLTLNHQIWRHYDAGRVEIARLYDALWREAYDDAFTMFTGDALSGILRFLD
jgi:hypothetical protein